MVQKYLAPSKEARQSLVLGKTTADFLEMLLIALKSVQILRLPSFLVTITKGAAHGLSLGSINPCFSNLSSSFSTASLCAISKLLFAL